MADKHDHERRRTARAELTSFCPTTFDYSGRLFHALMMNVSDHGARFQLCEHHTEQPSLSIGDDLFLTIKTPYGNSKCSGRVIWACLFNGNFIWGVEFLTSNTDRDDPLKNFLESSF